VSQESSILARYVETRSEDAFRALVDRYINVVYAAARRQTSDSHLAEDVTQAVFILLAQKGASVPLDRPLSAWLLKTTAYCAANVRRARDRRLRFEQKAAAMAQTTQDPSSSADSGTWESIAPMLDEGLGRLRSGDRDILLLRFFEGQDLAQIAEKLGVSKDAASKRISRAVEELRRFFQKRGVRMSAAALATMLAIKVTEAAPRHLVVMLSAKVGAGAQAALPITALPSKSAIAAGILIFTGAGVLLFHQLPAQTPASTTNTVSPAARPGRWSARFADGTVVEILGIREEPSIDNRWWGPDGVTVTPPGDRFTRNSAAAPIGLRGIRLALQARRLDLTDTSVKVQVGAAANVSSSMVDQGNTRVISLVAIPLPGVDRVTVEVGTASGKWKQLAL
jgi:RNA polymerase sigma factor (sigma-70 family)